MGQESRFKVNGVLQFRKIENFRQFWTYVRGLLRNMAKVLVREHAKNAYFRSASSESDNKWFSVEGMGTRLPLDSPTCLKPMTI